MAFRVIALLALVFIITTNAASLGCLRERWGWRTTRPPLAWHLVTIAFSTIVLGGAAVGVWL